MPQFQYIQLLWTLLIIPVLTGVYFYAKRKKKIAFKKIGDEALVKELTASYNTSSFWKKFALALIAMALILVSIANLRSVKGTEKISRNGIDIMIALDVSKSMLAKDIQPTRLDRAKQLLSRLIDKMSNDRVGIVVFAGKAYLQMPLTADHSAAKMYLSAATPETVPTQGTVIGDALKMCFASFNSKEKKYKAVILISDGEDHDENALKVAEQMAQEGVSINTIGIGSPQGAPIMDETTNELKKDAEGNTVITRLNEEELQSIADKGNGAYRLYTSTDEAVAGIYDQLATMDRRTVTDDSLVSWKSWFQYLLGAALLLLIIEIFISEIRTVSNKKMKIAATVFFAFLSFSSFAQTEKEIIKKGNEAYKKADYKTAAAHYEEAVKKNEPTGTAQYNLGNALYKTDKKTEAIAAYDKAQSQMTAMPANRSNAFYNKGVIQQNDNKLEECITSYKNALKLDPGNVDARHNLQLALKKQQEEKQKQDQKDKKDDDKDNNKNKKPDDKDNNEQPKPKPNISQKDAAQKLDALMQKEKELQDKLHKVNAASPDRPEKDW